MNRRSQQEAPMSEIRHGGNRRALAAAAGCAPEELLDFSVNLNPCGAPPGAFECYFRAFDRIGEYPEPEAGTAVAALAERFRRPEAEIVVGNGSNQLLTLLPEALAPRRAIIVIPGYQEYEASCRRARVPVAEFRLHEPVRIPERTTVDCRSLWRLRTEDPMAYYALGRRLRSGDTERIGISAHIEGRSGRYPVNFSCQRMPVSDFLNTFGLSIKDIENFLE